MPAVNPIASVEYEQIASLFLNYRLPAIGPARFGFLLECDFADDLVKQRIAYFVGRILGGTEADRSSRREFSSLRLKINLKTAKALGITIPRSLLLRADEFVQ
jgi:putative ABC transport system substrate-binding protein